MASWSVHLIIIIHSLQVYIICTSILAWAYLSCSGLMPCGTSNTSICNCINYQDENTLEMGTYPLSAWYFLIFLHYKSRKPRDSPPPRAKDFPISKFLFFIAFKMRWRIKDKQINWIPQCKAIHHRCPADRQIPAEVLRNLHLVRPEREYF